MNTNKNTLVPNEILEVICKYCEDNAIYDKLTKYNDFYYKIKKLLKNNKIITHPAEPMRVGSLVRWHEFPDRLYFILETNINYCGYDKCCKIIDTARCHMAIVHDTDLTLDDVDYDEI